VRLAYDDGSGTGASSVAAAFELSYRGLDETAARVFRLQSLLVVTAQKRRRVEIQIKGARCGIMVP
jgi:hypothetical protein